MDIQETLSKLDEISKEYPGTTVTMDIPLLTRIMELCREDIESDVALHWVLEKLIDLSIENDILSMNQYSEIESSISQVSECTTSGAVATVARPNEKAIRR